MAYQTNSFTIAHYILLFAVVVLSIGIISWTVIHSGNPNPQNNIEPVMHITNSDPCVRHARESITQMWEYNPGAVPQEYRALATQYTDEVIATRIQGDCGGTSFTCRPGQRRRECDPCAAASARQYAIEQQIADTIEKNCGQKN